MDPVVERLKKQLICFIYYEILKAVKVDAGMILDEFDQSSRSGNQNVHHFFIV